MRKKGHLLINGLHASKSYPSKSLHQASFIQYFFLLNFWFYTYSNIILKNLNELSGQSNLFTCLLYRTCFPGGSMLKNPPAMQEMFNLRVGKIHWRMKWQPTPVFLLGKSHGQRSLVGYSSWGHKESDRT